MSNTNKPIVKGDNWPNAKGFGQASFPTSPAEMQDERRNGYILGQQDMVAANYQDMSYYRRRSPSEKPEYSKKVWAEDSVGRVWLVTMEKLMDYTPQSMSIVDSGGEERDTLITCETDESHEPYFKCDWSPSCINWWAYAYISKE